MHYSNKNSEFHYVSNEKCRDTLVPLWEFQQKVIFSKKLERQTRENIEMRGILDLIQIIDNWVHVSGWDSITSLIYSIFSLFMQVENALQMKLLVSCK